MSIRTFDIRRECKQQKHYTLFTSAASVYCSLIQCSLNLFRFRGGTQLENNDLKFRDHPEIDLRIDQSV